MIKNLFFKSVLVLSLLCMGADYSYGEEDPAPLTVLRQVEHPGGVLEVKFENGLTLLCKENFAAPVVATRVFIRVGSIYEGDMLGSGVSHYFEHIISGGTTSTRSEAESSAILQRIGNNSNAYTSRNVTVYFITTEAQHFPTAANLLGDYMSNCLVNEEEFLRERGVIIQEIRKNQDNPNRAIYQLLGEAMFPEHPAGQPVIGYLDLFKKVTREQVAEFYHRFYVANNTTVAVVGAVKTEDMIKEIAASFANLKRGIPYLPVMPPVPQQTSSRWAEKNSTKINKMYLSIGHHTVTLDHPDLFALDVAADILGAGRTSRLYRSLREKGLVQGISAYSHTPTYNAGVFAIMATLEEKNLPEVLSTVVEEINRMKAEPVSREELRRVVKKKITDELFGTETMESQASDIGYNYFLTGDPGFTQYYLDGIKKVTPEEIIRVVNKYLTNENRTIALLRPEAPREEAKVETEAETTSAKPQPEAAAAEEQEAPALEKIVLNDGNCLLYGYDPNVESVLIQATFLGGIITETKDNNGICQLMASLLLKGTKERTKEELHDTVEGMGARIWSESGNNSWYAGMKLLSEDFEKGMDILAEVVLTPRFAEEDFLRERMLQVNAVKNMDDFWQSEAQRFFRANYFDKHPYAMHPLGAKDSLENLTVEDISAYHREVLKNPVIAVFGKVSRSDAVRVAEKAFGNCPQAASSLEQFSAEGIPQREGESFFPKLNNKTQVVLNYGCKGVPYGDEDIPAIAVLDTILSGYGYPSGRLHEALRGDADLVYFVHAWNWPGLNGVGVFQIMTQTSPENLEEVMTIIDRELARMVKEEVSAEELESARESIVISEAIDRESLSARALEATFDELYGVGYDFHKDFAKRVRAVTVADVKRVAEKYLSNFLLTATGPEEALNKISKIKEGLPKGDL